MMGELANLKIYVSNLEERNEFLEQQINDLKSQIQKLKGHDHCCNECYYHSDPHRRCILR